MTKKMRNSRLEKVIDLSFAGASSCHPSAGSGAEFRGRNIPSVPLEIKILERVAPLNRRSNHDEPPPTCAPTRLSYIQLRLPPGGGARLRICNDAGERSMSSIRTT